MNNQAGKGDRYRSVDPKKYRENYERIFGRKPMELTEKTWEQVTQVAAGKVASFFKPREILVIQDFIQTAKPDIDTIISNISEQETRQ